jgi:hypothetical protein
MECFSLILLSLSESWVLKIQEEVTNGDFLLLCHLQSNPIESNCTLSSNTGLSFDVVATAPCGLARQTGRGGKRSPRDFGSLLCIYPFEASEQGQRICYMSCFHVSYRFRPTG